MRRGFLFSMDALLAALILVGGLVLISSIVDISYDTTQIETASEDTIVALEAMNIYELQHPWVIARMENGSIPDENVTVLEQIGYDWAAGSMRDAQHLAEIVLNDTFMNYGVRLTIDGIEVYSRPTSYEDEDTIVSNRMVSGIAEGQAVKGSSASAYLKHIRDKRTASFTIFGGFVGQGNITKRFLDLPADANISSITLELAAQNLFEVYFNGNQCNGIFDPISPNETPDRWDLSSCNESLVPGSTNTISLNFTGKLNESYVAGGFLRVKYKTEQLNETANRSFIQYRLPGIDGIVNLFDAFYVPGTLENMSIYLHYNTSNSTFLEIGDKRVWEDEANGTEKVVILDDSYLRDPLGGRLDYDFLSNKTIPLRMAGFAPDSTTILSGNADVVLITDFSGSMKKAVVDWSQGNAGNNCNNDGESLGSPSIYEDDTIRRTELASCVDKVLTTTLFNYSGNRVWPVFLHSDKAQWYNNPEDESGVEGYINSFSQGKDKTCYACALNLAYDILKNFSSADKDKFIVFMTDGVPTHCPGDGCQGNSTAYGALQCEGMCDVAGQNCGNLADSCTVCTNNPGGRDAAYYAANRSAQEFNATIYTVGFGPIADCSLAGETLQEIAIIGNGTYQHSNDSQQLRLIYENISREILSRTSLSSQRAIVQGGETHSRLFDDSYINLTYELASQYQQKQNALSLRIQTDQACNPVVSLYEEQELIEAQAISYSGIHWTDIVSVNGQTVYNLSNFLKPYDELGDPTAIHAPANLFGIGANTIGIETGDSPTNRSGCSLNNSAIYLVQINLSTERSRVVPHAEGCNWRVQFEDDTYENMTIPASYSGANNCTYNETETIYNETDAYQLGTYQMFQRLDFQKNGKLFVNLREEDLEIVVTTISEVPYMWGPAIARLEVTR